MKGGHSLIHLAKDKMETNTKQNLSLVERYEKEGGNSNYFNPVISDLEELLNSEVKGTLTAEQEELLSAYKATFDWVEQWSIETAWSLDCTFNKAYECLEKDDVMQYMSGDVGLPEPEGADDGCLEIDDILDCLCMLPQVDIYQMKVKKQLVEQQFLVTIAMPPESLSGEEEVDLQASLVSCISAHIFSSHDKKDYMVRVELPSRVI